MAIHRLFVALLALVLLGPGCKSSGDDDDNIIIDTGALALTAPSDDGPDERPLANRRSLLRPTLASATAPMGGSRRPEGGSIERTIARQVGLSLVRRVAAAARADSVPACRYASANGRRRSRRPVAAKTALATAGAIGGVAGSPAPPGRSRLGTMCTSTTGIASRRSTS